MRRSLPGAGFPCSALPQGKEQPQSAPRTLGAANLLRRPLQSCKWGTNSCGSFEGSECLAKSAALSASCTGAPGIATQGKSGGLPVK